MGNKLCAPLLKRGYRNDTSYPWNVRKDSHLLRLWADVFRVHGDGEYMRWQRVSDDVVPINISCIEDTPSTVFQITAYNRHVEKIFDVKITQPGTIICPATESFVHWRDPINQCEWGLNFSTATDAHRFRDCCAFPSQRFARKASSTSSLRLSPPKRVKSKSASASSPSSPLNQQRPFSADHLSENCDHLDHATAGCNATERNIPTFTPFPPDDICDKGGFRYSAIIKPPSNASIYDNESGHVFNKDCKNEGHRQSMPSSFSSPSHSLQDRPASAVSNMTYSKDSSFGGGSSNDIYSKILVENKFPVEKEETGSHIETSINGTASPVLRPVSRLTVDTSLSVGGTSRHTSSSESPEWPSPPEPLTPITPLNPEYDIQFDSVTIQKMLRSLPSSPVDKEKDMGFHDEGENEVGYNGNRRRSSGLSRTKSLNVHDRNNRPAVPIRHRTTQINHPQPSPYVSTQVLTNSAKSKLLSKVLIEQELHLRNQVAQHSYPDSGIGGMTCNTSGSLLSEDSGKSEASKAGVDTNNEHRPGSSGASSGGSHYSDIINQLGEGGEFKQYLGELSEEDGDSDGSIDTMTETESQQSYTRQVGAIRKAGWLVVKNWLVHKKRKIELAAKRNWKKYWICLKGTTLLFFDCDEESAVNENSVPRHILVIEGGISQAVPEHPKRDYIFSLSTACGDAFLLQASSQIDLENWIRSIHSACASSFARQHGKDNTLKLLKSELNRLESNIDTDVKMKKMAELQMTVVSDPRSRMAIVKQIAQWEENLEKLYIEQYRFRCYIASLQGTELPNPKVLLANAAKSTKATLGRLGIFTVTSFHALVCARKPLVLPYIYGKGSKKGGLLSPTGNSSKARSITPTALQGSSTESVVKTNERILSDSTDLLDKNSESSSGQESLSRVTLPNKQTLLVGVDKQTAVKDLLESVCNKRQLNPRDHYVRIKPVGSQDDRFIIPDRKESIKRLKYDAIEVCQKSIFQLELNKTTKDGVFGFAVEAELAEDYDRDDELQVYVCDVTKGSVADEQGLIVGDEILVINGKIVSELDMVYIETLLHESRTLFLTVRSFRTQPPNTDFITQHADAYISNMVCPPPPSQSRISDKIIGNLIVPAPVNTETGEDTESSKHSSPSKSSQDKSSQDISTDQIDALLKGAEQVTAICRNPPTKQDLAERPVSPRPLSDAQRMRKVIMELIETERAYVKDLSCLNQRYLEPLREETFLTNNEINQLFGNIQEIVVFQQQFLQSLEEAIDLENEFFTTDDTKVFRDDSEEIRRVLFSLGGSFLYYANHFKVYSSFCASHSRSQKLLNPESNKALKEFLKARNPKQQHSATLESYLIKPIQRILKYPLLLQQLVNMSQPETDEHHHLSEALRGMEAVAEHINEMQKIYEEYGSIFDDLSTTFKQVHPHKQPVDLSVGELQMYGTVEWCNMAEYLGKVKKSTDFETIVFVFRTAVVFLCREKVKRSKKSKSLQQKSSTSDNEMLERFRTLIPTQEVQVRMGKVADMDRHYWWDLVHSRSDPESRPERYYQFCNSTAEAKGDFIKVIRHTIRESVRRMMIPSTKSVKVSESPEHSTKTGMGAGTKEPLQNPAIVKQRRANKPQDPERHSVDFEEKFSSLDYDNLFRTRSKTIGDINEAGMKDDSTFITASEPQISAAQNTSPNSSNSNLSSSNSGSAKLLFASANPLSYSSSSVNSGGSPVWKRCEVVPQPGNQLLPPIITTVAADKVSGKPPTGTETQRKDTKTVVFATPPFPVYKDTEC